MRSKKDLNLITAIMLLEFAYQADSCPLDKCGLEEIGVTGLACAACSFVQAALNDTEPSEFAISVLAKIEADTAIENAIFKARNK